MKGLVIPCCFYNEQTMALKELDIEVNEDDYEVAEIVFYNIDAISPNKHDDYSKTVIHIGETSFLSVLPFEKIEKLIEDWK